jgi:peptidoglycan/LPS O-acetylase OafA/YrhL
MAEAPIHDLFPGALEMMILESLRRQPAHGYALVQHIQQRSNKLLAFGTGAGLLLGVLASRVLAFVVYQASPRDPLLLAGVLLAMLVLGLVATWIPAQRALSVNPLVLLREE